MLRQLLLLLLFAASLLCDAQKLPHNKTILFIGAHPDDETAISEVLHKYARLGNTIFVIIATNGKDGTRVTKIPAGDSLGNLRKAGRPVVAKHWGFSLRYSSALNGWIPELEPATILKSISDSWIH